jgi:bifunctional non-homologous end joining protein LigD
MAVALPLSWTDLKLPERPVFQVANFEEWQHLLNPDPWKDFVKLHQRLGSL